MRVRLTYNLEDIFFEIPKENLAGIYEPNEVEAQEERKIIQRAIENPVGGKDLKGFLEGGEDILFLVNDGTRPTPTGKVLEVLEEWLEGYEIHFMVAGGKHRASTEDENRMIFGKMYDRYRDKIIPHDAKNDEMETIGYFRNGTPIELNKRALEADRIVVIGSVEPHYFAGYSGGRKAFIPGIASFKTIEENHKLALLPEAHALALKGNPVHEDMERGIENLDRATIFSIQTVLDREHRIYGVTAGDIYDSFYAAVELSREVFCVPFEELADIVVSVAPYPMDINLYQSQKAIENAKFARKKGGIIILVSACREGVGGKTCFNLLSQSTSPEDAMKTIEEGYISGFHKAAKIIEAVQDGEIWVVSELDDKFLKSIFMKPYHSIQQAIDDALEQKGPQAKIAVLPAGSITVPLLLNEKRNLNKSSSSSPLASIQQSFDRIP